MKLSRKFKKTWIKSVIKRSYLHLSVTWFLLFGLSYIVISSDWLETDSYTNRDWAAPDAEPIELFDALEFARAASDGGTVPITTRSEVVGYSLTSFLYEWTNLEENFGVDIFTAENMKAICEIEKSFLANKRLPELCMLRADANSTTGEITDCDPALLGAISVFFYALDDLTSPDEECELLPELQVLQTRNILMSQASGLRFFDRVNQTHSVRTRSSLFLGGPLEVDGTKYDFPILTQREVLLEDEQWLYYQAYLREVRDDIIAQVTFEEQYFRSAYFNKLRFGEDLQLQVRFDSYQYSLDETDSLLDADLTLALFSILFVGLCIYGRLRSAAMTACAVMSIIISIPIAVFFYTGLLGISYFPSLNLASIFLILGIGCDNIFVFYDAWTQSEILAFHHTGERKYRLSLDPAEETHDGKADFQTRMEYTLHRAASSIFVTMLTTVIAFLALVTSPFAPLIGFGVFTALTVFLNYVWVYLIYPPMLVSYIRYYKLNPLTNDSPEIKPEEQAKLGHAPQVLRKSNTEKEKVTGNFFHRVYVPFFTNKIVAWGAVLFTSTLFVISVIFMLQLESPEEMVANYAEGHMMRDIRSDSANLFAGVSENEYVRIFMSLGIEGIDRSEFDFMDPNGFRGTAVFDKNFDIAPSENQQFFIQICTSLLELPCVDDDGNKLAACSSPDTDLAVLEVECVLEDFYQFYFATHPSEFSSVQEASAFLQELGDSNKTRFLEELEFFTTEIDVRNVIGFFDSTLSFMNIIYTTTVRERISLIDQSEYFDMVTEFKDELRRNAPEGLRAIEHTSFDMAAVEVIDAIIQGLLSSLSLSLPLAFLVLLCTTNNLILATYAIVSILAIISLVMGTVYIRGWQIDEILSIVGTLVVGLSVDYTIHLAACFQEAAREGITSRFGRFEAAAVRMGPSVSMGAITTAGSVSFLLFTQIAFFLRIGFLLLCTVIYSILFALTFFLPLLRVLGPEDQFGQVKEFICGLFSGSRTS
eukprot:augustus_masked-scaffold_11-processed-gene-6.60-mRNA-1 protein AED:1.00 eAED:1.00 QI:0/-1/0/0/-1/1/1/0/988